MTSSNSILKGLVTNDVLTVKNGIDRLRNGNQLRRTGAMSWVDSVSSRTNTIASRDQIIPIIIGDNAVVNYNG